MKEVLVRKADGQLEAFDPSKLRSSLLRSGAEEATATEVVNQITNSLTPEISTRAIYRRAFKLLENRERKTAARYSLKRAISELGPSGFPFERFIARLHDAQGWQTATGVTLSGACITHEIDVVAVKDDNLTLIEAKFHNDDSLKSDSKDVMYIKARFDDLKDQTWEIFGENRKMTCGMLITNTKFSSAATAFASCKGMGVMGWSYPAEKNLRTLIESSGLHPVTCLTSLSGAQKRHIVEAGMVLCRELIEAPEQLEVLGMTDTQINETVNEATQVIASSTAAYV